MPSSPVTLIGVVGRTQMGSDVTPRRLRELPPLDPSTVQHIRESAKRLPENSIELAQVFYQHLFEMAPQVRGMFPRDMSAQEEKLLNAIVATVGALDDPVALEATLRRWGAAHRRAFGVTDAMYVYVGHALVRTVKILLSDSSAVLSSWVAVYEWLAAVMIDGAEQGDRGPAPVVSQADPNRFSRHEQWEGAATDWPAPAAQRSAYEERTTEEIWAVFDRNSEKRQTRTTAGLFRGRR
jgi:hemoglobin-like flavoprotein